MPNKLIADSGSTKCHWCLLSDSQKPVKIATIGISPYFLSKEQIDQIIKKHIYPKTSKITIDEVHFYGTGLSDQQNRKMMQNLFRKNFPMTKINIDNDLSAAAFATCGTEKGMISILGTGSGCAFYNGKNIVKQQHGLGYILGDEGSGSYLGKRVIQYYLYNTFDDELMGRFEKKYHITRAEILNKVYHEPLANRFLAGFAQFLSENRGHYMIENIIEDGLNDFFNTHIYKFREAWTSPLNFVGGVAYGFRDIIKELCNSYELELGVIMKQPIDGLIKYHSNR